MHGLNILPSHLGGSSQGSKRGWQAGSGRWACSSQGRTWAQRGTGTCPRAHSTAEAGLAWAGREGLGTGGRWSPSWPLHWGLPRVGSGCGASHTPTLPSSPSWLCVPDMRERHRKSFRKSWKRGKTAEQEMLLLEHPEETVPVTQGGGTSTYMPGSIQPLPAQGSRG